jgi:GDP-L-fucose synthase
MAKKVLVTGGAGFVGRHLCHELLRRGDDLVCVDSIQRYTGGICPQENNGWPLYDPRHYSNFQFIRMDCREYFQTHLDTDFDEVYHLAALVGGREMIENKPLAVAEDLAIDSMFWIWAQQVKPKKIACFSSSAAYPVSYQQESNYRLLKENMINFEGHIGHPDLSYGWSKLTHEYLAQLAHEKHGLNVVVFRPFSGYGEDQDLAYPFPSLCRRVLESHENISNEPFYVWGSGRQMRDFIHIKDCVRGILSMLDKISDASAVNLSTGIYTSFIDFARLAFRQLGEDREIIGKESKPEGVFARGGDTELQQSLGFVPKISLNEGIRLGLSYQEHRLQQASV